jgi:hypothetical protein
LLHTGLGRDIHSRETLHLKLPNGNFFTRPIFRLSEI